MTSPLATGCEFPGCHRGEDNGPALTDAQFCPACRRRFRRLIDDVVLDFALVKAYLPKPVARPQAVQQQASGGKTFGHPAEWASVTVQEIAQTLREHHGNLAEDNREHFDGHTKLSAYMRTVHAPPPARTADETVIVRAAHKYLTDHFDVLCEFDGAVAIADELADLHRRTRSGLGQARAMSRLDVPCPACGLLTLARSRDSADSTIDCRSCGRQFTPARFALHLEQGARFAAVAVAAAIDDRVAAYDRARRLEVARARCAPPAAVAALAALETGPAGPWCPVDPAGAR